MLDFLGEALLGIIQSVFEFVTELFINFIIETISQLIQLTGQKFWCLIWEMFNFSILIKWQKEWAVINLLTGVMIYVIIGYILFKMIFLFLLFT